MLDSQSVVHARCDTSAAIIRLTCAMCCFVAAAAADTEILSDVTPVEAPEMPEAAEPSQ